MTERDVQCARCGSSFSFEPCDQCGGDGTRGHECGEDCCSCADPEDNVPCDFCDGTGSWGFCLSSAEWCWANPRPGREGALRHTPEWFEMPRLREQEGRR